MERDPLELTRIVLDGETVTREACFCLIDGSRLLVRDRWRSGALVEYSYSWRDASGKLIMAWDNAHEVEVATAPHHKHLGENGSVVESWETDLISVLNVVRSRVLLRSGPREPVGACLRAVEC